MDETKAAETTTDEFPVWYLVAGMNHWGRGHTISEAVTAMPRKVAAKDRQTFLLPKGADKPFVDEMGYMRWSWLPDTPDKDADVVEVDSAGKPKSK